MNQPTHEAGAAGRSDAIHDDGMKCSRRAWLVGGGAALTAAAGYTWLGGGASNSLRSLNPVERLRSRLLNRAAVFIARDQRYDGRLEQTIQDGLVACGVDPATLSGKRVLLKPNLVEPTRVAPHMTTHPAVVVAAAEVFRRWGADVSVGEGPGHVRDTELALVESGLQPALEAAGLAFADLNYSEVGAVENRGAISKLRQLYLPRQVLEADLVVSMPKLKTHHWIGFTASMKNLYGVMPGIKYGWPKNVLHHAGIPETVLDINISLPKTLAIVDAITCMEGDGPILGTPKEMGLIVVGNNAAAVDATCARMMGIDPWKVALLAVADRYIGPVDGRRIAMRGERWEEHIHPFQILDFPHLQELRATKDEILTSSLSPPPRTVCDGRGVALSTA